MASSSGAAVRFAWAGSSAARADKPQELPFLAVLIQPFNQYFCPR
jgi:hypothetical protein